MRNPFTALRHWHLARPPIVRRLNWTAAVVVVLALAAVGVVTLRPDHSCGTGVEKRGGDTDCTGVTDGSYHFTAELGPVSDRIAEANSRIVSSGKPYATIALMIPMTPAPEDRAGRVQVVREVQGAYLAQYRANRKGSEEPPVRLVLASPGRDMARWKDVSDQLAGMARSGRDKLRAVFGFNLSVERTKQTIDYLTNRKGIAVVGGPITADDLANDKEHPRRYPGLAKIVPSNSDQARALTHHLKVGPQQTFLVEDTHADDLYSRSLRAAFRSETKGTPFAPEQYDSSEVTPNDFAQMVNNLCDSKATTVYFSGRPPELAQLVRALGSRGCADRHYRVVTVSGASTLALDPSMDWDAFSFGAGLTVEYATVTHEGAWTSGNPPATGGSKADFAALSSLVQGSGKSDGVGDIGPTDLADGRTITTHDSAMTAIAGIRNRATAKDKVPDLASIAAAWPRLHGNAMVKGASGWICLNSYGTPYDKAVAIVKLSPDPARHIQFETLAWPDGAPPAAQCTATPD